MKEVGCSLNTCVLMIPDTYDTYDTSLANYTKYLVHFDHAPFSLAKPVCKLFTESEFSFINSRIRGFKPTTATLLCSLTLFEISSSRLLSRSFKFCPI